MLHVQATSRLLQLIDDQDYEVRTQAIKFAFRTLNSDNSLVYAKGSAHSIRTSILIVQLLGLIGEGCRPLFWRG